MRNDVIDGKWKELRGKIRQWQEKRSDGQLSKREQFAEILQKRYGYPKEKAISEVNQHYSKIILG